MWRGKMSTLILGNRQTDPLLNLASDLVVMERFQKLDAYTWDAKASDPNSFLTDGRTMTCLEMHSLIHHTSHHKYQVTNGYRVAKMWMDDQMKRFECPFDTVLAYRLIDVNGRDVNELPESEAESLLLGRPTIDSLLEGMGGLVVLPINKEPKTRLDKWQYGLAQELRDRLPAIVTYAYYFADVIALNDDIGKNPERYKEAGGIEIHSRDDFLNG